MSETMETKTLVTQFTYDRGGVICGQTSEKRVYRRIYVENDTANCLRRDFHKVNRHGGLFQNSNGTFVGKRLEKENFLLFDIVWGGGG